ncbi:MAG: carbohydrate kinase [Salegentibacter sp.]
MLKKIKAVCFGEVLWDVFPDKERIGGAPLNVASRLAGLGIQTEVISKVGSDERGAKLLSSLRFNDVEVQNIAEDDEFPTGVVKVRLSKSGSATYEITYPSAWDKIELNEKMLEAVSTADVFIFGSLVCRDGISRKTLFELIAKAKFKVLDFNLRPPHYDRELLLELIQKANLIKFNDDELFEISEMLGSHFNSLEQNLHFIAKRAGVKSICVTKGRHGAVYLQNEKLYYNSGYKVQVKDTVGAGDSFLASLIAQRLKGSEPQQALDFACAVGALVAGKEGANPPITDTDIKEFMHLE